jgi:hypothetical protein
VSNRQVADQDKVQPKVRQLEAEQQNYETDGPSHHPFEAPWTMAEQLPVLPAGRPGH